MTNMNQTNNLTDYPVKKQKRLQEIKTAYFPPPPKGFLEKLFNNRNLYTPCENYLPLQPSHEIPLQIHYPKKSNYQLIAVAFIFGFWPHIFNMSHITYDGVFGSIVAMSIIIGLGLKQLLYRKPLLVVSEQGLLFTKENLEIDWAYVIAAHIAEEKGGEDTNYFLVIDYYDTYYGYCKVHRFEANGYDTTYPTIAATIAYCWQKANTAR